MKTTPLYKTASGKLRLTELPGDSLHEMTIEGVWGYIKTEDVLFWLVNMFMFFEYFRPQTIYPVLDIIPYNQTIILLTTFLLILKKEKPFVSNIENKWLLLFLIVILLSSANALSPSIAYDGVPDFLAWVLIYFIIINIVNTPDRFLFFMLMFLLFNFKMAQYSFRGWVSIGFSFSQHGTGGGPGWFENSGEFGIQMCIFLALSVYFVWALKPYWPKWKFILFSLFPVTALTGIISSSSRGAILGGVAVLCVLALQCSKKIVAVIVMLAIGFALFLIIPDKQIDRFNKVGDDRTSVTRLERWDRGLKIADRYPYFGVGLGNWGIANNRLFEADGALSHNLFIECISELGYVGLGVFLIMVGFTFANNYRSRQLLACHDGLTKRLGMMAYGLDAALVGYLVSGFFVTVFYYPFFWINLAMTVALNNIAVESSRKQL